MNPFKFIDNKMKAKYQKYPGYTIHIRYHYLILRIIILLPLHLIFLLVSKINDLLESILSNSIITEPVKYVKEDK
jgi:hypothetical protein